MNINTFILMLLVLFLSIGVVSANELSDVNVTSIADESPLDNLDDINLDDSNIPQASLQDSLQSSDVNVTSIVDESPMEVVGDINYFDENFEDFNVLQVSSQSSLQSNEDIIVVSNWDELQYYCAQTDKDYTLKLKENTNFYPTNPNNPIFQIKIRNNVKILGSEGSWIGDSSSEPNQLTFLAIVVEDDIKVGLTLDNVTFKWIKAGGGTYLPDGMLIKIGGKKNTIIKNCKFYEIKTLIGHSCIIHLNKGTATFDNCSIINCTNSYGCLSVFNRNGASVEMVVKNCYFENNYGSTEPGCINNCGKLTVYNTTFVKNRSFWWAGAIHTHGGGNTTIYDSNFIDNVAGWNGGALYTYAYLQVYNSVFRGNNCTTNNGGGAIGACQYESNPHIYIKNCLFEDNANNCWAMDSLSAGTGRGGAISLMDVGSLEVCDTTFISNAASIGTAICAWAVEGYGSPDVIIVNNSFINHTRLGDTLNVRIWNNSYKNISDNYYRGNSIEFSNLTLTKLSEGREQATFKITATLSNPTYYDEDILDKTFYDVYINNKYAKTVNTTVFSVDFGDFDICDVYVIPTISNRKSNEVTMISTREYVFVSKSNGNDSNNGLSRDTPVYTIKRALELANVCQNIILLDGDYSESNVQIDYSVTIKGESNATLTGATSFISNANFTLKNLKINNLSTVNFIKQNTDNLFISKCSITNNDAVLVYNNGFTSLTNSILLNNSKIVDGNINDCVLDYNWWGNAPLDLSNYVTLNLTSDVNSLENNQKANVKVIFYLNDGSKYTNLPDINLDVTALNGVSSQNTVNIDSSLVYTLTAFSDGVLTVSYNNVNVTKTFEFLKTNPTISLTTNDIMFGDNVTITVTTPNDAGGNLTVSVGNQSQTKVIESPKSTFTFENLKADTYVITLTYSGDKKYLSKDLTSTVNVNKYESTTQLNLSAVNVGEDVIITITTIDSSTGNVTLSINNNPVTLTLTNSKANYTIKNIKRGDYLIRAVYNGDDKYLTSQDSKFIEVDNLNATMTIKTDDIAYGETAIIKVTLNSDAAGNVIVTIDSVSNQSKVSNGKAEVTFANLEAGSNKNISVFYSGDDTYFNLTNSSTFNIAKADLTFNIYSDDIKIGQFAEIIINVPQRTSGTFTINNDVINIPLSGEVSYVIPDLEIGNYTYTATYNGNNYYTVSKTTSFAVREYPIPQVPNEGFNTQNTHKSPYESLTNGEIAFTIPFNETLSGDLVVDSLGNVYLTTQNGIYAFNQTRQLWYFTSTAASGNLSGIAIGRDVIIAPKSGDTLYFINQTTGERYGSSNIYQGSSLFAPVVDANATLYIVSEYQYSSEDYKLTIIPYKLWENGGNPTLVSIGNAQPLCAPTLNDDVIVIVSDNRLRMIDAKSLQTISIKSGSYMSIRPVIGEGNIVYAVLSDSIVAYNSNGVQVWKTKVTGKVGTVLAVDPEQAVYHINSKKLIYKYDIIDGSESKLSNLKVTSGLLIGSDGTLYFGSNNMFYALDSEGNILWRSDLNAKIIGNPVMDESGLIYVTTENGIVALTHADLKDSDLKIMVDDIVEGQKATVTITWNSQVTGIITGNVNGEEITANADDLKITKVTSALSTGYYDVEASYSGDMRFKATTITKTFVVRSTDDVANNIQFDGNSTFSFSLNNAQGNLTVNVAGKTYSKELTNGKASITIDKLSPGEWDAVVTYSGDRQFNKANRTFSIEIPKYNVTLNEAIATENIVTRITVALSSDATGNLTLSVGTKKYTQKITNGNAVIIVDDLAAGNYTATLTYSGDSNYESASKSVNINPTKIPVILDDSNVIVESGAEVKVSIKLNANATGRFTVSIDGEEYSSDISEELIISGLEPGNYTGTITYSGDFRFSKASKEIHVEVPKITLQFNDSNFVVSKLDDGIIVNVTLPGDARGDIMLSVNGTNYTDKLAAGVASVKVTGLTPENWQATVTYAGSDKYEAISKVFVFSIGRVEVSLNDTTLSVISPSPQPVVNVGFDKAVTGNITVTVNDREFLKELINGCASVELTGLHPGNYSVTVAYSGDVKYGATEKTIQLEVPKITATLDNIVVKSNVTVPAISVMLPSDATGDLIVNVTDNLYAGKIIDGSCSVEITGLAPGNYTALVSYSGDSNYTAANKTVSLEVPKIIISLIDDNCMWNASQVSVNLSNATGTLTVEIAGKTYTKELNNGSAVVDINNLNPGSYDLRIIYSGDNVYTKAEKLVSLEIPKIKVAFDDGTLTVNSTSVSVDLPFDATGNITVVVSAKSFIKELADGKATVNVDDLAPGCYNATVTYSGDDKYGSATKIINVNVAKVVVELNNNTLVVDSQNVSSGVSINLPEDATGTLTVTVDGKNYTQTLTNGKATVNIPELAEGSHNITVTYSGDGKYESITKNSVINVNGTVVDNSTNTTGDNSTNTTVVKADPMLIVSAGDVSVGESAVVNVRTSVETGKLIVNVNDVDYELVISNGESSVNIPDLAVGIYNVIARFAGDDKFNEATNSTSFSVLKVNVPVTNETITLPESDSAQYSISLPSDATGTLTVTVDGVPYTQSLSNGKATVNIPELAEGSHNITVSYSGDGKYSPITKSSVVVKKHVPVIKLTASNLNMLYTSGKYFKVRLTSDGQPLANKSVKITINGKTYSKTTDKNGYASMKISLAPKTYTVKATYANLTVTKKVTVKSIITAKNINSKRSAKTVKIKVTLKKVNGKYLKNKKITLKFNKKTFKAKTNKKGVVTFTIKNSVYKKLKTNKKYTYQVIYGKDKVKKTIKFKK